MVVRVINAPSVLLVSGPLEYIKSCMLYRLQVINVTRNCVSLCDWTFTRGTLCNNYIGIKQVLHKFFC